MKITRRQFFLGAAAMASSTLLTGCPTPAAPPTKPGATGAPAAGAPQPTAGAAAGAPAKAGEPITISIIDVGGDLNSTKDIIENFKKKFPDKVKEIKYQTGTAPELPAKVKIQQDAGKLDTNLLLHGQDAGAFLRDQKLLLKIVPDLEKRLPMDKFNQPAKYLLEEGEGFSVPPVVSYGGPLFIYNPNKVKEPPKSVDEFKAWCKANPGKFQYARPANSGPGRSILQGAPFFLKDKDPKDPINGWEKSWAFLKEIGQTVEYYPTRTAQTMKEFGEGIRWMMAGIMEWEMNPRAIGTIPMDSQIFFLPDTTWVIDGHFWSIPKGVSDREREVLYDLIEFMLQPEQQAYTYKAFIGPVVTNTSIDLAPKEIQDVVKKVWRPEYAKWNKEMPNTPTLPTKQLVDAMDKWDREVGADRVKVFN